jgi:hypothetical protein
LPTKNTEAEIEQLSEGILQNSELEVGVVKFGSLDEKREPKTLKEALLEILKHSSASAAAVTEKISDGALERTIEAAGIAQKLASFLMKRDNRIRKKIAKPILYRVEKRTSQLTAHYSSPSMIWRTKIGLALRNGGNSGRQGFLCCKGRNQTINCQNGENQTRALAIENGVCQQKRQKQIVTAPLNTGAIAVTNRSR